MNLKAHNSWILGGLYYGLFLFSMVAIAWPLIQGNSLDLIELSKQLAWWIPAGLLFEFIRSRKTKNASSENS